MKDQTFTGSINIDASDANNITNLVNISTYGSGKATISSAGGYGFQAYNTQGSTVSNLIFAGSGISLNNTDGVIVFTDLSGNVKLKKITLKNMDVAQGPLDEKGNEV